MTRAKKRARRRAKYSVMLDEPLEAYLYSKRIEISTRVGRKVYDKSYPMFTLIFIISTVDETIMSRLEAM